MATPPDPLVGRNLGPTNFTPESATISGLHVGDSGSPGLGLAVAHADVPLTHSNPPPLRSSRANERHLVVEAAEVN